jgi:hypothetical protein
MTTDDFIKSIIALALWREDRGGGLDGMIAVGCCLANRVKDWKQSWQQVLEGKNQLSSMTVKGDPETIVYPDTRDPLFIKLLAAINDIYGGRQKDLTNGSHWYANPAAITSGWFKENIVDQPAVHPVTARVGGQTFWK